MITSLPRGRTTGALCRLKSPFLLVLTMVVGSCGLPQFGPTFSTTVSEKSAAAGRFTLVEGEDYLRTGNALVAESGFPSAFLAAGVADTDILVTGDKLSLMVIENVTEGVFATAGNRLFQIPQLQVLQSGKIFIPYVGQLQASGRRIEELRQDIVAALDPQTPDPQVSLERVPGSGASVTVLGAITAQGVYPIEVNTLRLTAMLARAGGTTVPLEEIVVRVERGKQSGEARLSLIAENPRQDIALRSGDRITLVRDDRTITVLGAAGGQVRIPVPRHDYRLIDLLGDAGGLNGDMANAKGIFVFRSSDLGASDTDRLVIRFDLSTPAGVFAARSFRMRSGDTVYVSEAPIRNAQKVIATITGVTASANDLATVGQ